MKEKNSSRSWFLGNSFVKRGIMGSSSSTGEGVGKKEIQNRGSFGFPIAKESTEFGFIRATQTSLSNQPASHCRCRQRCPEVHLWGVGGDLGSKFCRCIV